MERFGEALFTEVNAYVTITVIPRLTSDPVNEFFG